MDKRPPVCILPILHIIYVWKFAFFQTPDLVSLKNKLSCEISKYSKVKLLLNLSSYMKCIVFLHKHLSVIMQCAGVDLLCSLCNNKFP